MYRLPQLRSSSLLGYRTQFPIYLYGSIDVYMREDRVPLTTREKPV